MFSFAILVALAPGLLAASLGIGVCCGPFIADRVRERLNNPTKVERLRDVLNELSKIGSAVALYIGISEQDAMTVVITVVWFFVFNKLYDLANTRVIELREREVAMSHRKMAGTVRSIVRDEVRAALAGENRPQWTPGNIQARASLRNGSNQVR